jgi:nucleotide-binding universal stress UspA family protein
VTEKTTIFLFFEDGSLRRQSAEYAVELANRLGCSVSTLMLLDADVALDDTEYKAYRNLVKTIGDKGIEVTAEVHSGDKASQALKAMAQKRSVDAIVWGGDERVVGKDRIRKQGHWLSRVAGLSRCPIVAPVSRSSPQRPEPPSPVPSGKKGGVIEITHGRERPRKQPKKGTG